MNLRVNHIGIPVSDLDRSTDFYLSFGGRLVVDVESAESPEQDALLGLEGAKLRLRHILVGHTIVELLCYSQPEGKPYVALNNDIGASHLGFQVDDVQAVYEEMSAKGVEFNSPPMKMETGPFAGGACVFCKDPDGIPVEILQAGPNFAAVINGTALSFDEDA